MKVHFYKEREEENNGICKVGIWETWLHKRWAKWETRLKAVGDGWQQLDTPILRLGAKGRGRDLFSDPRGQEKLEPQQARLMAAGTTVKGRAQLKREREEEHPGSLLPAL